MSKTIEKPNLKMLKRGIPQSLSAPGLPAPEEILELTKYLFERLIPNGLADVNGSEMTESEFWPWGDDFLKLKGFRIRGKRLNYDRLTFFADENDPTRFACREKLYLENHTFLGTNFWESDPRLQKIKALYEQGVAMAATVARELAPEYRACEDMLMPVRYSVGSPDASDRLSLAALGSRNFGSSHDDETFFSLHFAESHPELVCWNYNEHKWAPVETREGRCQLLLGDYARLAELPPNTHRLEPVDWGQEKYRYSALFEKTPEYHERINLNPAGEPTSQKIGVLIRTAHDFGAFAKNVYDTTKEKLQRLFPDIQDSAFFNVEDHEKHFQHLAKLGFEKILVLENGFFMENPALVKKLLYTAANYPEKYSYKIRHDNENSIILINLKGGRAATVDQYVLKYGWAGLKDELPSNFDPIPPVEVVGGCSTHPGLQA